MINIDIWNDLGDLYLKADAIEAAIGAYNKAIEQGYQSSDIYKNLAGAYVSYGNINASIPCYQKSIDLLSDNKEKAIVLTYLGDSYRRMADFTNAIAVFKEAIEIDPGNPALSVGLSEVQRDLEKLYSLDEKDAYPVSAGSQAIDDSETTGIPIFPVESFGTTSELIDENNDNKLLALLPVDEEKVESAEIVNDVENDSNAQVIFGDSDGDMITGEQQNAHVGYSVVDEPVAIENTTSDGMVHSVGSVIVEEICKDKVSEAISSGDNDGVQLEVILEADAGVGPVDMNLSTLKEHAEVASVVVVDEILKDQILSADEGDISTDIDVPFVNDIVQEQLGTELTDQPSDNIQNLEGDDNREKEDGVRVTLLLTLGVMHWRNGNLEKSDEILQSAIEVSVKIKNSWFEALSWHALALVKTALGDIVAAIDAYLRAVDLAPEQIFPWNNIGSLYSSLDCNSEAMLAFQKAIRQNPEDSTSWDGLGDLYAKLGRLDDAIAAYQLGNVFEKRAHGSDAIKAYEKAFDFYKFSISSFENEISKTQDDFNQTVEMNAIQAAQLQGDELTIAETSSENLDISADHDAVLGEDNSLALETVEDKAAALVEAIQQPLQEMSEPKPGIDKIDVVDEAESNHIFSMTRETIDESIGIDVIPATELVLQNVSDGEISPIAVQIDMEEVPVGFPVILTDNKAHDILEKTDEVVPPILEEVAISPVEFLSTELAGELKESDKDGLQQIPQDQPSLEENTDGSENCVLETVLVEIENSVFTGEVLPTENAEWEQWKSIDMLEVSPGEGQLLAVDQVVTKTDEKRGDKLAGSKKESVSSVVSDVPSHQDDSKRIAAAILSYETVVKINPKNDRAWDSLGNLYRITERNTDAILAFEQAVSLEPTKYVYHYQLGTLYAVEGKYTDAIREIQQVVELNPTFIFAHCALASYLRRTGQDDEAQQHIAIAGPHMANEKEYDRACFESIRGNIDGALELLKLALEKKQTTIEWIRRDLDLDFIRHDARYELLETRYLQSVVEY